MLSITTITLTVLVALLATWRYAVRAEPVSGSIGRLRFVACIIIFNPLAFYSFSCCIALMRRACLLVVPRAVVAAMRIWPPGRCAIGCSTACTGFWASSAHFWEQAQPWSQSSAAASRSNSSFKADGSAAA